MKTCLIIGAAPYDTLPTLSDELLNNSYVVAADGGLKTAIKHGIHVDHFIGDMDSLGDKYLPANLSSTILPIEKDYSDVHTAVMNSLQNGYRDFLFIGCTGGRIDHSLANIALLENLDRHGAKGIILDRQNKILFLSSGKITLERDPNYAFISIIPLDEKVYGVTLYGMKYPLIKATLSRDIPISISNEALEGTVSITIESGRVLIILSRDEDNEREK